MHDCTPINTPMKTNLRLMPLSLDEEGHNIEEYRSIIRALNYTAVLTRLDIATAVDRKSTRLNSSHRSLSRMPSSA